MRKCHALDLQACTDSPSLEPLKNLGLDPQEAAKLAVELHAHSI